MSMRISVLILILSILPISTSFSQGILPADQSETVTFPVIVSDMAISLEDWDQDNPPDLVKMNAYRIASGLIYGIPFHYQKNRDSIRITWQIDGVPKDLKFVGYSRLGDSHKFEYSVSVPNRLLSSANNSSFQGHGVDSDENLAVARAYALDMALEDAVDKFLRKEYTDKNKALPGILDGRILRFEIENEFRDPDTGDYVIDLKAWVSADAG